MKDTRIKRLLTTCGFCGLKIPDSIRLRPVTNELGVCVCNLLVVVDVCGGKILTGTLVVVVVSGRLTITRSVVELLARGNVVDSNVGTKFVVAKLKLELSTGVNRLRSTTSMAGFFATVGCNWNGCVAGILLISVVV